MGRWWIVAQLIVARSVTERFGMKKIRYVTVDVEAHVASVEPDDGVRLCGCILHHHLRFLMVSVVGEACSAPILLSAKIMVGSTALEM